MRGLRLPALLLAAAVLAGCAQTGGPDSSDTASAPAQGSGPSVQVDWSRLETETAPPQADIDGGRWYPEYTDHLIPREDYGPLVSYVGSSAYPIYHWTGLDGQEQVSSAYYPVTQYGLMTREGRIVVEPVYQYVTAPSYYRQGAWSVLPVLLLSRADSEYEQFCNGQRYAVAAQDGSWCTEFEFWAYTARENQLLLLGRSGVSQIDADSGGRKDWSWAALGVQEEELPSIMEDVLWVWGFEWMDSGVFLGQRDGEDGESLQVRLFHPDTGAVSWVSCTQWEETLTQWWGQRWPEEETWQRERSGDQLTLFRGAESHTLTVPQLAEQFSFDVVDDLAFVQMYDTYGETSQAMLFRLSDGELLLTAKELSFLSDLGQDRENPLVQAENVDGSCSFYTMELEPVLTTAPLAGWWWVETQLRDGLLTIYDGESFGCFDLQRGEYIFYRNLTLGD